MMVTLHESREDRVWGTALSLLSTISSVSSERQLQIVVFILHPGISSLGFLPACYQASRFVQDSSLQASLPERYNSADWFLS